MPRFRFLVLALASSFGLCSCTAPLKQPTAPRVVPTSDMIWNWTELPALPPPPGEATQIGVAGPFAGIVGANLSESGALLVAGGANFPVAPPWKGGAKIWVDNVFILRKVKTGQETILRWESDPSYRLPRPLGYGVSVTTEAGVLCIGGCDAEVCRQDVFLITWNPVTHRMATRLLAPLPRPLAFMAGALVGDTVYVAGGQESMPAGPATRNFFAFDLAGIENGAGWRELEPWPGAPRIVPVAAAQRKGDRDCFYLFSGRNAAPGGATEVLTDAWEYDPAGQSWRRLADIAPPGSGPIGVMAGVAAPLDDGRIAVFGGDEGAVFLELERLGQAIGEAPEGSRRLEQLKMKQLEILENHPGFSREIVLYDPESDAWSWGGRLPISGPVTTLAVGWDGAVIIPSGEVRPGVRTPSIWAGRVVKSAPSVDR